MAFIMTGKNNFFNVIWAVLFAVGSVFLFVGITNNTLWYDESFCGAIVNHSFIDIIKMSANDNHPPFYFILSKVLIVIFGNNAFSLRSASLLGVIALAALGFGPVRRVWGENAGLLYTLLVFVTPGFVAQAINARMYTWAAFFCTACTLYAYMSIVENKRRDWIIFGVATVLGLYTHVYLMLECLLIYVIAFLWIITNDRKKLSGFIIVSISVSALYLPWALVLINQAAEVVKEFWIPLPTVGWVLEGLIFMPFQHEFNSSLHLHIYLIYAACFFSVCLLFLGMLKAWKSKNSAGKLFFLCLTVSIFTIASAFVISFQLKPILFGRYLTSILGLYILTWVYGILYFKNRISGIISVCLLLGVFIPSIIDIKTVKWNGPMAEIRSYIDERAGFDDVFVHNDEHSFGIFCYYYPEYRHYLMLKEGFSGYSNYDVFRPSGFAGHDYAGIVKVHRRAWVVNRNTSNYSMFPYISNYEFETNGKQYMSAPEKRFVQRHSFLDLNIAEFSSNIADKYNDDVQYSGEVKECRIVADGFRNIKGKAIINIYNRELYELSEKYLWQNKDIPQIEKNVVDKLVTNNKFLLDEEKSFFISFYTLDNNDGVYKLSKNSTKEEIEKQLSIVNKLTYERESTIVDGKAQFQFNDLPKDKYFITIFHDENGNNQLDWRKNGSPAEGSAVSGADSPLQNYPTFNTNNIVLAQDDMDTIMHIYYY